MKANTSKGIAVIFGSSGGIGNSIYNLLKNSNKYSKVYGFSRKSNPDMDINSEKYLNSLAENFLTKNFKIKLLINTIVYNHKYLPEKKYQDISLDYLIKSFKINTIPTALLVKYFSPLMESKRSSTFATISAKVGSIEDNILGGWYSYRASKAALNQIIKTAAIEHKRKNKNLIFVSIHPGTVSTKLSEPFIGNKKVQKTDEAALKIINVLENLTIKESGLLIDYKNQIIPY